MNSLLQSLLLASLPLGTLAAEPESAPLPPDPSGMPPQAFHAPRREQVAMRIMVRQLLLERYDANQDGQLNGEERRRLMEDAHAARRQQALTFIRRFDADGDGRLSPEERENMQQAVQERRRSQTAEKEPAADTPPPPHPRARRHHGRPPHMDKDGRVIAFMVHQLTMDAYDADKNGILDTTESERLRADGASLYATREAELLALHDADKDGRLSHEELQAALQALKPGPTQAPGAENHTPPPPHHHRRGPIHRLLDTHFDVDILLNLARPQAEEPAAPPCTPSTPLMN